MDSAQHAEQLTARVCRIISQVGLWGWKSRWRPDQRDLAGGEQVRKEIAELIAKLWVLDHILGEEIASARAEVEAREARQEPGVDVLTGAEG